MSKYYCGAAAVNVTSVITVKFPFLTEFQALREQHEHIISYQNCEAFFPAEERKYIRKCLGRPAGCVAYNEWFTTLHQKANKKAERASSVEVREGV
jgi:hypothetical protein